MSWKIDVLNKELAKKTEPLLKEKQKLEKDIARLDAKIKTNDENITKTTISTALLLEDNEYVKRTGCVGKYRKLISDFKSAPNNISELKNNIKFLEGEKEKLSNLFDGANHLRNMLFVAGVIKGVNEALAKQQEKKQ